MLSPTQHNSCILHGTQQSLLVYTNLPEILLNNLSSLNPENSKLKKKKMASPNNQAESPSSSSISDDWRQRILIPTILAGIAGGGVGLVSKYRKVHGLANISATYATNFAIVTGCYCGAREFVTATRKTGPDDLLNSAIAGFGTGAILGRLQGGVRGAYRYSVIFAVAGTAVDFAALKLRPKLHHFNESMFGKNSDSWKLPEWSPIQVLDEEALAAKRAREEKLYGQGKTLSKEES